MTDRRTLLQWVRRLMTAPIVDVEQVNFSKNETPRGVRFGAVFTEDRDLPTRYFEDALVDLVLCTEPLSKYQALEAAAVHLMTAAETARKSEQ